jgi:hypothetical protein
MLLGRIVVVTAANIERLFKQYLEGNRFECADALYLCVQLGRERASETLLLRYRMAAPLTAALEDMKQLGVSDPESYNIYTEDTHQLVRDVILKVYENICLDELLRRAENAAKNLTPLARAILYLALRFEEDAFNYLYEHGILPKLCEIIFQLRADPRAVRRSIEELVACYIFQHPEGYYLLPSFFDKLARRLETYLPKVEVKVIWPERV